MTKGPWSELQPRTLVQKTLFLFGVSVTVPLVLLGALAWAMYAFVLLPQYESSVAAAADQTAQDYQYRATQYEFLLSRISADANLQTILSLGPSDPEVRWASLRSLNQTLEFFADYLPGLTRVKLFYDNPNLPQDGDALRKPDTDPAEADWFRRTLADDPLLRWDSGPGTSVQLPYFRVTRQIRTSAGERLGLVWAQIDGRQVWEGVSATPARQGMEVLLLDSDHAVLDATRPEWQGRTLGWDQLRSLVESQQGQAEYRFLHRGWILVQISPKYLPLASVSSLFLTTGAVAVFLVILDGVVLLLLLQNLRRRLAALADHMGAVSTGDFVTLDHDDKEDELGEIERSFNQMSARLDRLMNEVIEARIQEMEESFRALQAQINPHFLYNSLGVLRWMALDGRREDLCRAVDALAQFYRITLKDHAGFIPVADEIAHARAYLEVQRLRFRGAVVVEFVVDPQTEAWFTIKLVLQPLVENCYSHGQVFRRADGRLRVTVAREGDAVRMEVWDNGKGMDAETLRALNDGTLAPSGTGGYGLANIRDRLRLCFGDRARLEFASSPHQGTTVAVVFPVCPVLPDLRSIHGN